MNIVFIAPPAAGKGTQAELVCGKYNLNHLSTGDLLREVTSKNDEFGQMIKEQMNQGKLISDDIIMTLITNKLKELDGFIFDGFPRNVNQAKLLDNLLASLNKKIDYVFYFKIDKELALNRIIGRISCPKCGRVYNDIIEPLKPIKDNLCDDCNTELVKRLDDNAQTFSKRFETYISETEPVISYYKNQNNLYEIDSSKSKEEIFKEIENIIND